MDTKKLIQFLGYSSIFLPFDDFLLSIGIKKRPNETSYKARTITAGNLTLEFIEYNDYIDDYLIEPLSEGRLILERVSFEVGFSDQLPFGLSFSMNSDAVLNKLGMPLEVVAEGIDPIESWLPHFYYEGFFVVVRFNQKNQVIDSISVSRPTKYNRAHFGLK